MHLSLISAVSHYMVFKRRKRIRSCIDFQLVRPRFVFFSFSFSRIRQSWTGWVEICVRGICMLWLKLIEFDNEERDARLVSNRHDFGGVMDKPASLRSFLGCVAFFLGRVGAIHHVFQLAKTPSTGCVISREDGHTNCGALDWLLALVHLGSLCHCWSLRCLSAHESQLHPWSDRGSLQNSSECQAF